LGEKYVKLETINSPARRVIRVINAIASIDGSSASPLEPTQAALATRPAAAGLGNPVNEFKSPDVLNRARRSAAEAI
jgi:hypothetical protein